MRALGSLLVAAGMLVCDTASAEPIFVTGSLSARTLDALRIRLSDIGPVELDVPTTAPRVSVRVEQASATELVVTVVSDHDPRAIVRSIQIPSASDVDVDSAIALKIAALVEESLTSQVPVASKPVVMPRALEVHDPRAYVGELGIDGLVGMQTGMSIHAAGGLQWHTDHAVIETVASIRVGPEDEVATPAGQIEFNDTGAMIGGRIFTTHSILAFGAHADVGMRRLAVSGMSPDGRTGEATAHALAASPGVDLRWLMTTRLELRASVSALLTFDRPIFSLDGMAAADVAAPAALTTMSVVFRAP